MTSDVSLRLQMLSVILACSGLRAAGPESKPHPPSEKLAAYPIVDEPLPGYEPIRLVNRSVHFRNCAIALGKDGLAEASAHEDVQLLSRGMAITGGAAGVLKCMTMSPDPDNRRP